MRERNGVVVWFTGLSGSGKSTLAWALARRMNDLGWTVEVIDGDDFRKNLSYGLGFSRADRKENMRRAACLAEILVHHVDFVLVALIAPYREARSEVTGKLANYLEVYVNAPLSVCETRDPKGLYAKARDGRMKNFTGFDDPYEPPLSPELECRTDLESIDQSVRKVLHFATCRYGANDRNWGDFVSASIDAQPNITAAEIAKRLGVSRRTLANRLQACSNKSFREIRDESLLIRADYLLGRCLSVKEVAFQLRFGSPSAFNRFYLRLAKHSPRNIPKV